MFEFIETPFFTKPLDRYLNDDEYRELQSHLIKHPESGKAFRDPAVYEKCVGLPKGVESAVACG